MTTTIIHSKHEISPNVCRLLESIAQAELTPGSRQRLSLSRQLREQGFTVAIREVNYQQQTVDLYISKC